MDRRNLVAGLPGDAAHALSIRLRGSGPPGHDGDPRCRARRHSPGDHGAGRMVGRPDRILAGLERIPGPRPVPDRRLAERRRRRLGRTPGRPGPGRGRLHRSGRGLCLRRRTGRHHSTGPGHACGRARGWRRLRRHSRPVRSRRAGASGRTPRRPHDRPTGAAVGRGPGRRPVRRRRRRGPLRGAGRPLRRPVAQPRPGPRRRHRAASRRHRRRHPARRRWRTSGPGPAPLPRNPAPDRLGRQHPDRRRRARGPSGRRIGSGRRPDRDLLSPRRRSPGRGRGRSRPAGPVRRRRPGRRDLRPPAGSGASVDRGPGSSGRERRHFPGTGGPFGRPDPGRRRSGRPGRGPGGPDSGGGGSDLGGTGPVARPLRRMGRPEEPGRRR